MFISEQGKFIFVHVQKNAGIAIETVLKKNYPDAKHWHGRHGHAINGINEIGREKWDEYFSFSFVRNPWDRLVSWYSMIQGEFKRLPSGKRKLDEPFNSPFWNHVVRDSHDFKSFLVNCTDVIFEKGCFKSYAFNQTEYLADENGNNAVNFVGRFENLADDISIVFERLGIKTKKLRKENAGRHDHYSRYYTEETREIIRQRFQRDIETFNYQFVAGSTSKLTKIADTIMHYLKKSI